MQNKGDELKFLKEGLEIVRLIRRKNEFLESFSHTIQDGNGVVIFLDDVEAKIVNLLKETLGDSSDWIGWWLYEKDWGKKEGLSAFDKNNKELPSTTVEDLYNLIKN